MEDLISLDDKVLDDIYQYHLPPVRRIPPLLWSRIRADLPGYLSERAADGVIVLNWYHQQFREAAIERYFKNLNHLQVTHSAIADYFLGVSLVLVKEKEERKYRNLQAYGAAYRNRSSTPKCKSSALEWSKMKDWRTGKCRSSRTCSIRKTAAKCATILEN